MFSAMTPREGDRVRVLIIKTGYSETLDQYTSGAVSLGDVLRTTVILHLFPRETHEVTWLTDLKALPLVRDNPLIDRILTVNPFTPHQLMNEWFDVVINFEKEPGICAVADKIPAWRRYGFRYDHKSRQAHAYDHAIRAVTMGNDPDFKRQQRQNWSELLYEMLGTQWAGQRYVLGYRPKSLPKYDFGLNHQVGVRYPLKRWPDRHWQALHDQLSAQHSICWQEGERDIEEYIEWIASCRVLVTNDSLGLHIALALHRPVVALFGPTLSSEVADHPELVKLVPEPACACHFSAFECCRPEPCIATISVDRVAREATSRLKERHER